jgi:PHS family inorganic phosphate transporter-like MFS transporter
MTTVNQVTFHVDSPKSSSTVALTKQALATSLSLPVPPCAPLTNAMHASSSTSSLSEMIPADDAPNAHAGSNLPKPPPLALLGFGFALDAYDLFVVNAVLIILSDVMKPTDFEKSFISTMALFGSMIGQIIFGTLGDAISHRSMFLLSVSLMLLGSLVSGLLPFAASFYVALGMIRFVLGFGIGGEYPLSAALGAQTVVQDVRNDQGYLLVKGKTKSGQLARIFAFQGMGTLTAILAGLAFYHSMSSDRAWRACFLLGALPCIFLAAARYYYLFARHSESSTDPAAKTAISTTAAAGKSTSTVTLAQAWAKSKLQLSIALSTPLYRRRLWGAALNWFLLDIVFYANGIFSGTILNDFTHKVTADSLKYNAILGALAVVGYLCAIALIDRVGRRTLQLFGFIAMAVMYLIAAVAMDVLRANFGWFLVVYGLTFLFCNGGPNTTTYVVAAESFPSGIRATCSGWSAAAGKLGAALGALVMAPVATYSLPLVFYLCAAICVLGAISTAKWTDDLRHVNVEVEQAAVECRRRLSESAVYAQEVTDPIVEVANLPV